MVRIRLRRTGAKKKPSYRVVVANQRSPRNGRFIENIGTYDPCTEPESVKIQLDRASHWMGVGAQPSEAVARLLRNANLIDDKGKLQSEASWKSEAEASESILIDDADVGIAAEDVAEEVAAG